MTRKSKREIERALEDLGGDGPDHPVQFVIRDTVIQTSWSKDGDDDGDGADVAEGDVVEETETVIEL